MNIETISPIHIEAKEKDRIGHNTIRRVGSFASREYIDLSAFLEAEEKAENKRKIEGEFFEVSSKKNKEITSNDLNGNTGLALLAQDERGKRYVYLQEYSEKGVDALRDTLYTKLPEGAELKRAVILTPQSETKGNFSKDDNFLDHLSLIIDHYALQKNPTQKEKFMTQAITYSEKQNLSDYNPNKISIRCLENGDTQIYHGDELVENEHFIET